MSIRFDKNDTPTRGPMIKAFSPPCNRSESLSAKETQRSLQYWRNTRRPRVPTWFAAKYWWTFHFVSRILRHSREFTVARIVELRTRASRDTTPVFSRREWTSYRFSCFHWRHRQYEKKRNQHSRTNARSRVGSADPRALPLTAESKPAAQRAAGPKAEAKGVRTSPR